MKPILFCDFDGVINQFPFRYEKETDGSHDVIIEHHEQTNYGFLWDNFDEENFFKYTDFVMLNTIKGTFPITYSKDMVNRLCKLILSDKVEFVWLTTWREEATHLLNPLFEFPESVTFIPWTQKMSDYNHAGKAHAIMNYFEEDDKRLERKMIWLDDVATRRLENWDENEGFITNTYLDTFNFPEEKLIILTDEFYGLSKKGMSTIEDFVS